jgi:hypothetical protein
MPKSIMPYLAGLGGANVLDLATTKKALDTGKFKESNPLLGDKFKDIAIKKSVFTGIGAATTGLLNKNHPKLAKTLAVAEMAVPATAAYLNYRKLQGQ